MSNTYTLKRNPGMDEGEDRERKRDQVYLANNKAAKQTIAHLVLSPSKYFQQLLMQLQPAFVSSCNKASYGARSLSHSLTNSEGNDDS